MNSNDKPKEKRTGKDMGRSGRNLTKVNYHLGICLLPAGAEENSDNPPSG
jgi:hypothetical protein